MTRLKNSFLGVPIGKSNDLIFRSRKGTSYFCGAPVNFKKSNSPKSVEIRDRMKTVSPLAKAIDQNFSIRGFWERSDIEADCVRNKIIKINFPALANKTDISTAVLVPLENLFSASVDNWQQEGRIIQLTISPLNLELNEILYPEISACGVIHLETEVDGKHSSCFFEASSGIINYKNVLPLTFNFTLDDTAMQNISEFDSAILLCTLILYKMDHQPAGCSVNIFIKIK